MEQDTEENFTKVQVPSDIINYLDDKNYNLDNLKRIKIFVDSSKATGLTEEYRKKISAKLEVTIDLLQQSKDTKNIVDHGLPELGERQGYRMSASSTSTHDTAKFKRYKFGLLPDAILNLMRTYSAIWNPRISQLKYYFSEVDIVQLVRHVLDEAFDSVGLYQKVELRQEYSFFKVKPDFWLVQTVTRVPIGVIEIRTPDSHPYKRYVQMYDFLLWLKSFYGVEDAFGIHTTYKEWTFCWLPESQSAASATTVNSNDPITTFEAMNTENENLATESVKKTALPLDRKIHISETFMWNDPTVVKEIASMVLKMYRAKRKDVVSVLPNGAYIAANSNTVYWTDLSWKKDTKPCFKEMPQESSLNELYLVMDLGGGRDGRVWLAVDDYARVCVIKFLSNANTADTELSSWKKVNEQVFQEYKDWWVAKKIFGGSTCFVMPYINTLNWDSKMNDEDEKQVVDLLINMVVREKIVHNDLEIQHVGHITPRNPGNPKIPVLIDFSEMGTPKRDPFRSITKMMTSLQIDNDSNLNYAKQNYSNLKEFQT